MILRNVLRAVCRAIGGAAVRDSGSGVYLGCLSNEQIDKEA
jgi:hypothetical protein